MKRFGRASSVGLYAALVAVVAALVWAGAGAAAQEEGPTERPTRITAVKYRFDPAKIEVYEGDLVRVELKTSDIAHSFTVDAYRIAKRVNPGHPIAFEFRADRTGTFPFYCNLQIDDGCRQMHGELIVRARATSHQ